jgi:predicted acetyltransferase
MILKIIKERDIAPELDQNIREALCRCFPDDIEFFKKNRAWHGSLPEWSIVVLKDNKIIAHVAIVSRNIKIASQEFKIAGIQNVFVLPEYRGQGLCRMIMNSAMQQAKDNGFDVGLLYCVPELGKTYAKCGWLLLAERIILRTDNSGNIIPLPSKNITMFFPLKNKELPEGNIDLQGNDW